MQAELRNSVNLSNFGAYFRQKQRGTCQALNYYPLPQSLVVSAESFRESHPPRCRSSHLKQGLKVRMGSIVAPLMAWWMNLVYHDDSQISNIETPLRRCSFCRSWCPCLRSYCCPFKFRCRSVWLKILASDFNFLFVY